MSVFPPQQQPSNWDNNVYVVTVTRILLIMGATYLIRSVYQYITRLRLPDHGDPIPGRLSSDLLTSNRTRKTLRWWMLLLNSYASIGRESGPRKSSTWWPKWIDTQYPRRWDYQPTSAHLPTIATLTETSNSLTWTSTTTQTVLGVPWRLHAVERSIPSPKTVTRLRCECVHKSLRSRSRAFMTWWRPWHEDF